MKAQIAGSVDREGLLEMVNGHPDTVYVINFWATWCSPCVSEIGYFEELYRAYEGRELQVLLLNLDFPTQVDSRVRPFIREKSLTAPVYNITEMDYNSWIPELDPGWSGAIPATLIMQDNRRLFFGREITRDELFETVESFFQ